MPVLAKTAIIVAVCSMALPLLWPVFLGFALVLILAGAAMLFAGPGFYALRVLTRTGVRRHNIETEGPVG